MSTFSKKINLNPDVLLEFIYDDTNYQSDDYKVLTNLKDKSKSYLSKSGLNSDVNNLVNIDNVNSKYSPVSTSNFNFLKIQNFSSSLVMFNTVKLYFPSGFDFYNDQVGLYLNAYTYGYDNQTIYNLSNFYYTKDNTDPLGIYTLSTPFLYNGVYWVKSMEINIPSVYDVSNQRVVTNSQNAPISNSLNYNLTNGEGLSINSPIFIDFAWISSSVTTLGIKYLYVGDITTLSLPQAPEYDEIGVEVKESTNGDYFEIYGTYLGSNENMDDYVYNQTIKGQEIILNYIISIYEENILSSSQTIEITENFSQKILYRPILLTSNTTAAIDVELKIINKVDNSYTSKLGSIGITNSINKYGRTLTRLNVDSNVIKTDIYNIKYKNVLGTNNNNGLVGINGSVLAYNNDFNSISSSGSNVSTQSGSTSISVVNGETTFEVVKVPYPVMYDKYNILVSSSNSSSNNDYISNGLLTIIITSFDNIINFNIAKDVNSNGIPTPYDLSDVTNNSNLTLVFKSDTDSIEKTIYNDAENYYQYGITYFKINSSDYTTLKKIYNAGYDNFYIVLKSSSSQTQLYSGKFIFYENVSFVSNSTTSTNSTLDAVLAALKPQTLSIDDVYLNSDTSNDVDSAKDTTNTDNYYNTTSGSTITTTDDNYINLMIYVRFQTNQDLFDSWLTKNNITPKYKYSSVYMIERIKKTMIDTISTLSYVEKVFQIPLNFGSL